MAKKMAPDERIAYLEKLLAEAIPLLKIASDALDRSGEYRMSNKAAGLASRIERTLPKTDTTEASPV